MGGHQSTVCSEASASPAHTLGRVDVVFDNVMCLACSYCFFCCCFFVFAETVILCVCPAATLTLFLPRKV